MARGDFSKENDFARLYAVAIKYQEMPLHIEDQKKLLRVFHDRVYQDGKPRAIDLARPEIVYSVARKLHESAKSAYDIIKPQLKEGEKLFLSKVLRGLILSQNGCYNSEKEKAEQEDIEERISIMLEGCKDSELRGDIARIAGMLLPPKD